MKLESQVCSLELSQKLKELGVKQESLFWWAIDKTEAGDRVEISNMFGDVSAFTVAELGEMLPNHSHTANNSTVWVVGCTYSEGMQGWNHKFEAPTEADARAKMLIYLLENKLI